MIEWLICLLRPHRTHVSQLFCSPLRPPHPNRTQQQRPATATWYLYVAVTVKKLNVIWMMDCQFAMWVQKQCRWWAGDR